MLEDAGRSVRTRTIVSPSPAATPGKAREKGPCSDERRAGRQQVVFPVLRHRQCSEWEVAVCKKGSCAPTKGAARTSGTTNRRSAALRRPALGVIRNQPFVSLAAFCQNLLLHASDATASNYASAWQGPPSDQRGAKHTLCKPASSPRQFSYRGVRSPPQDKSCPCPHQRQRLYAAKNKVGNSNEKVAWASEKLICEGKTATLFHTGREFE